jgi:hypothetical protein
MTKSLVKLVSSSILPAATLIVSKLSGLFIALNILHIEWNIAKDPFAGSVVNVFIQVPNAYAKEIVSSYSNVIMITIMIIVLSIKVFQSEYLDDTKISPKLLMRLAENNLMGIIRNSFDLYYENFLWLIFSWIGVFSIGINTLMGISYSYIFFIAFTFLSILTVLFIRATNANE